METTLTPKQLSIVRYIREFRRREGYSPTMQQIGDHLGCTKVTVFEHVNALVEKGVLHRGPKHKARSLQVSDKFELSEQRPTRIPLAGRIAAGEPIEAVEDVEHLDIEEMFDSGKDTFVLEVTGNSMIDEQIRDGDYVICERRNTPHNGETVVALLPEGEATLKKFYKEGNRIRLQPANPDYQPIYTRNVNIQGVVVGVVRRV
ncbi:MAG: transcriptional repressor LexA [Planctomycetota bacterium]